LGGEWIATDEVKGTLMDWLKGLVTDFCDGDVKLLQHWNKCLNGNVYYIEK
jgi:hypothetical protein